MAATVRSDNAICSIHLLAHRLVGHVPHLHVELADGDERQHVWDWPGAGCQERGDVRVGPRHHRGPAQGEDGEHQIRHARSCVEAVEIRGCTVVTPVLLLLLLLPGRHQRRQEESPTQREL